MGARGFELRHHVDEVSVVALVLDVVVAVEIGIAFGRNRPASGR
jgi:hypothetical protein